MAKELVSNVLVDGKWYGPDYDTPLTDEVAKKITNPAAFEAPEDTTQVDLDFMTVDEDESESPKRSTARRSS